MAQNWTSVIFVLSAVFGVSAYVPRQYIFVDENKTWTEAQSYCRQTYTDLATVNNMEEMKKLNATLKDEANSSVWIGLVRRNTTRWLWSLADGDFYSDTDQTNQMYRNWGSGQPDNANGSEFCVGMVQKVETWFDMKCGNLLTFVCYNDKKKNAARYVFVNETRTWRDAQSHCREYYTDLVSVRNLTENQLILNLTKRSLNANDIWIGLFRDSWTWSDRSSSSFRYWKFGPNKYGEGETCAAVFMTDQSLWNNVSCTNKLPFMCHMNKLILIKQNLTWSEALRYCRENHVDLVSVHSEEIQLWVEEVVQEASTEHVWLGMQYTCTQGFWFWVSGESICYQNWAPGNGTGGEDCSSVERTGAVQSGGEQQWVSLPETQRLNFICITYEGLKPGPASSSGVTSSRSLSSFVLALSSIMACFIC